MIRGQRARKDLTRERILAAQQTIETEISVHGFYPHNSGKVNLLEVLRRAGVGSTTLRNSHHHEVRKMVQNCLALLKKRDAPITKPANRTVVREKIVWYEEQLKLISADALTWQIQKESLVKENQHLKAKVAELQERYCHVTTIYGGNTRK